MMIATYKDDIYSFVTVGNSNYLVTHKESKIDDSFVQSSDYFVKKVNLEDKNLTDIKEIRLFVKYKDDVEDYTEWLIDAKTPLHTIPDIIKNELGIFVLHDSRDSSWVQFDKNVSTKIIHLEDCEKFIVETTYFFRDGRYLDRYLAERTYVDMNDFKQLFIFLNNNEV